MRPYEKEYIRKDGSRVPVLVGTASIDDEARAAGLFVLDLTEHREAETARAKLVAIVESSNDAIISQTLDGIITTWNHGAERLFGYTPAEAIGRPLSLLVPRDAQDRAGLSARADSRTATASNISRPCGWPKTAGRSTSR